jgi:hypothetical protein
MEYYSVFPFPQDREDFRMARLAELINNVPQSLAYKNKGLSDFVPNYLREQTNFTEEAQIKAEKEFAMKYTQAVERAKGA